jgi:hypothetical protein
MADDAKPQKVSIGFAGGPVLSTRINPAELASLRQAMEAGGWHDVKAEDSTIALDLSKVVYVLVDTEAHRVGFGG